MKKEKDSSTHRTNRSICLPFTQEIYCDIIDDPVKFRKHVDKTIELFPELCQIKF